MNKKIVGHVENTTKLSRKAQLESYDSCARLRPVWDEIASKFDAIITPSVVDEAPIGIASTGDAVSTSSPLSPCSGPDRTNRVSARCGLSSKYLVSMCRALQEKMACRLDSRWSVLDTLIFMCCMSGRRLGNFSNQRVASSQKYFRLHNKDLESVPTSLVPVRNCNC